jgi:protein TonB
METAFRNSDSSPPHSARADTAHLQTSAMHNKASAPTFLAATSWSSISRWALGAAAAHALLLGAAIWIYQTPPQAPEIFSVSLLPMSPPAPTPPAPAPSPKPQPVVKKSQPQPTPLPKPAPVNSETAISQAQSTPTPSTTEVVSSAPPSGADKPSNSVALVPAHDAAYLNNPRPAYPSMSRRLGEEGRVMLEVQVQADGTPSKVALQRSSGFPRLDEAALEAVKRWRFVPAKRGGEAVAASVIIPMPFILER